MQSIVYLCIAESFHPCAVVLPNEICTVRAQVRLSLQKPTLSHKLSGNWRSSLLLILLCIFLLNIRKEKKSWPSVTGLTLSRLTTYIYDVPHS
jgi:hypothetical protein